MLSGEPAVWLRVPAILQSAPLVAEEFESGTLRVILRGEAELPPQTVLIGPVHVP